VALAVAVLLTVAVASGSAALHTFDLTWHTRITGVTQAHLWLVGPARMFSQIGQAYVVIPVTVVTAAWQYVRGHRAISGWLVTTLILGWVVANGLKPLVKAQRPPTNGIWWNASGYSFPSGHAAVSVYCYGALALLAWWSLRGWVRAMAVVGVAVLGCGIAASRLVLAVHWPSDVIGGALYALVVVLVTTSGLVVHQRRHPL